MPPGRPPAQRRYTRGAGTKLAQPNPINNTGIGYAAALSPRMEPVRHRRSDAPERILNRGSAVRRYCKIDLVAR